MHAVTCTRMSCVHASCRMVRKPHSCTMTVDTLFTVTTVMADAKHTFTSSCCDRGHVLWVLLHRYESAKVCMYMYMYLHVHVKCFDRANTCRQCVYLVQTKCICYCSLEWVSMDTYIPLERTRVRCVGRDQ